MKKLKLDVSIQLLATATCKTLSGKSTLTYHIGRTPDSEIHFRIHGNTGGGFFSPEWIAWKDIQVVLEKHPAEEPVTSYVLQPLFRGKSVNTPAFLLAALANEKLLRPLKGKKRGLEILDPEQFLSRVEKLTASKSAAKPSGSTPAKPSGNPPVKPTKKAAIKKKAISRRKAAK